MFKSDCGLKPIDASIKRVFDLVLVIVGLAVFGWLIIVAFLFATLDTGQNGFFTQPRVGRKGKIFYVMKIRTMKTSPIVNTTVTTESDPRITRLGSFFRRAKIDELPQLINVLLGDMSFVGPRPDVPGYADLLKGADRIILSVRPGITGPATLKYRHEERILGQQEDPQRYNDEVIFPDKVRINRSYVENYSLWRDLKYIVHTIFLH